MSRKISHDAARAFFQDKNFSLRNTQVKVSEGMTRLYLHGNKIAEKYCGGSHMIISDGGYPLSMTTRDRLEALGIVLKRKNWEWFLFGEPWEGNPKTIIFNRLGI